MKRDMLERLSLLKSRHQALSASMCQENGKNFLEFFVEIMPKVIDAERCSIFINDPTSDRVWLKCGTGVSEKQIVVPKSGSLVGEVISTGQYKMVSDITQRSKIGRRIDTETGFVPRNMLSVPIKSPFGMREATGAIQMLNKKGGKNFDQADRLMLEKLANLLELVIQNVFISQDMAEITEQLTRKVSTTEWLIRFWVGLTMSVILGVIGVAIYVMPQLFAFIHR